jgi:hypothetical protein
VVHANARPSGVPQPAPALLASSGFHQKLRHRARTACLAPLLCGRGRIPRRRYDSGPARSSHFAKRSKPHARDRASVAPRPTSGSRSGCAIATSLPMRTGELRFVSEAPLTDSSGHAIACRVVMPGSGVSGAARAICCVAHRTVVAVLRRWRLSVCCLPSIGEMDSRAVSGDNAGRSDSVGPIRRILSPCGWIVSGNYYPLALV